MPQIHRRRRINAGTADPRTRLPEDPDFIQTGVIILGGIDHEAKVPVSRRSGGEAERLRHRRHSDRAGIQRRRRHRGGIHEGVGG